jgi:hypothetical protein
MEDAGMKISSQGCGTSTTAVHATQLHIVDPVQKLEVGDVHVEQERPDEAQRSQYLLNSLQAPSKEQQQKTQQS